MLLVWDEGLEMLTKPIALVGLAAVMLAAGAGSYVAVRQNAAPIH